MNNAAITFAVVFLPFSLILFGIGIYKNVSAVKLNNEITKLEKTFTTSDAVVNKYIIREVYKYVGSGRSDAGYSKEEYDVYLEVEYNAGNKLINSSGFFKKYKTIQDVLSNYESLPNAPPLFYQQKNADKNTVRDEVIDILSNYKIKQPAGSKPFVIRYSTENPSVNQLTTKQKKSFTGIFFVYGFGVFVTLLYLLFCALAKAGTTTNQPLLICAGLLILFLIFRMTATQVSIDREPLPVPGFEIQVGIK